jgi:maltooligosyltrehalose trehalohydrolase
MNLQTTATMDSSQASSSPVANTHEARDNAGDEPFQFGPVLDRSRVRFQLWAPDAGQVAVLISDSAPIPLTRTQSGFWQCWCETNPGMHYCFEVDGLRVPDPASRFQPEDIGGWSQLLDEDTYVWKHIWRGRPWTETVIYEAHVGILGGYEGVRARLPALAELGITALELMPLAEFAGELNWGYDGVLPFAPERAYGHPDELRALIDEAHGLGMMVFLDVVYNHFGPDGNWLPAYASRFFDEATKTPWGAAIDYHQPAVRRFFIENALYWLNSFRFDGLRLDAVHAIDDRSWLVEMAASVRAQISDRRVHLLLENENNDAALLTEGFEAQWNDDFHNVLHVLLTGEKHAYYADFAAQPAERLARCLGEGFIYQGEGSPNRGGRPRGESSAHLPPTSFVAFLQNHDQVGNRALGERLTQLARPGALKAAMGLLLLCPQVPLLFMGEEVGAREPFLFFTDFHGELADAVREGRRREFAKSPGFVTEESRGAIPDPNDIATFLRSRWTGDAPDAEEWRALVRELLSLRHSLIVPGLVGVRALGGMAAGEAAVVARWRLSNETELTLACNLGVNSVAASLPDRPPIFGTIEQAGWLAGDTILAWLEPRE